MTQRKQTEAEREQEAALRLTEQTTEHDDYAAWCEDVLATALCYRYDPIAGIEGARVISHAHVGHGMGGGWVAGALLAAELEGGCGLAEDQEPAREALARAATLAREWPSESEMSEAHALYLSHYAICEGDDKDLARALAALFLARER